MPTIQPDHPLTRASVACPLCSRGKDKGLVTCWECYKSEGLRMGNAQAEQKIDTFERTLKVNKKNSLGLGSFFDSHIHIVGIK